MCLCPSILNSKCLHILEISPHYFPTFFSPSPLSLLNNFSLRPQCRLIKMKPAAQESYQCTSISCTVQKREDFSPVACRDWDWLDRCQIWHFRGVKLKQQGEKRTYLVWSGLGGNESLGTQCEIDAGVVAQSMPWTSQVFGVKKFVFLTLVHLHNYLDKKQVNCERQRQLRGKVKGHFLRYWTLFEDKINFRVVQPNEVYYKSLLIFFLSSVTLLKTIVTLHSDFLLLYL